MERDEAIRRRFSPSPVVGTAPLEQPDMQPRQPRTPDSYLEAFGVSGHATTITSSEPLRNDPHVLGFAATSADNNLNLLRFLAASGVIFSHSYPLSGYINEEPLARLVGVADISSICVIIFFIISGYLVTQSVTRAHSARYYLASRFLRIFPALAATTFFAACVVGPLATHLPLREYFSDSATWQYVYRNLLSASGYALPGVFATNPLPLGVNGSLWTVRIEVFLYLMILVTWLLQGFRSRVVTNLALAGCMIFWLAAPEKVLSILPASDAYMTPRLVGSFMWGIFFYANRTDIRLSRLVAVLMLAFLFSVRDDIAWLYYTLYFVLAYTALLFAFHPAWQVSWFNKLGDYSYGLYVFAFPVQQLIQSKFGPMQPMSLFATSYPLTLCIAILSWRLVERPALRMKYHFATPRAARNQ